LQIWRISSGTEVAWQEESSPARGGDQSLIDASRQWLSLDDFAKSAVDWKVRVEGSVVELLEGISGRRVATLEDPGGEIVKTSFSPGNRWLATLTEKDGVRLWPLQGPDLVEYACKHLSRNLTPDEWRQIGMDGPYRKSCPNLP
jgi:hypothetical protein